MITVPRAVGLAGSEPFRRNKKRKRSKRVASTRTNRTRISPAMERAASPPLPDAILVVETSQIDATEVEVVEAEVLPMAPTTDNQTSISMMKAPDHVLTAKDNLEIEIHQLLPMPKPPPILV